MNIVMILLVSCLSSPLEHKLSWGRVLSVCHEGPPHLPFSAPAHWRGLSVSGEGERSQKNNEVRIKQKNIEDLKEPKKNEI